MGLQEEAHEISVSDFYYAEIKRLALTRTDCEGIFSTKGKDGILVHHYVQTPDSGWTRERAAEQIALIRQKMEKS